MKKLKVERLGPGSYLVLDGRFVLEYRRKFTWRLTEWWGPSRTRMAGPVRIEDYMTKRDALRAIERQLEIEERRPEA